MSNDYKELNDLYSDIYEGLKSIIHNKEEYYKVRIFHQPPNNPYLPNVQFTDENKEIPTQTLDYQERKYPIEYKIDIYAQDIAGVDKRVITNVIEEAVSEFMRVNGFNIQSRPILNLDTNVRRIYMRCTSTYDVTSKKLIR